MFKSDSEEKMMEPLISVIIACYNCAGTIKRAIGSVMGQTYKNLEIIAINDGSTDYTMNILKGLAEKDNRIKIISREHKGIAETRNEGLRVATGNFIFFVDSDDEIRDDTLEDLYKLIKESYADVAVTGTVRVYPNKEADFTEPYPDMLLQHEFIKRYGDRNGAEYVRVWGKLFRKEMFNNVEFPKGMIYEDAYVFADLYKNLRTAVFSKKHGYLYYQNKNSIMHSKHINHELDGVDAAAHVIKGFASDEYRYALVPAENKVYANIKRALKSGDLSKEQKRQAFETLDKCIAVLKKYKVYPTRSRIRDSLLKLGVIR